MKRKPNRGCFRPGRDPRRHRFTQEQRSKGWYTTITRYQWAGLWLFIARGGKRFKHQQYCGEEIPW